MMLGCVSNRPCASHAVLCLQLVKMPWHGIAKLQGLLAKPWDWTMELVLGRPSGSGADAKVGMLRLVNAHDLVPMLPPALPVPGVL